MSRPWVWRMGAHCQSIHFPLLFALLLLFGAIVVGRRRLTHTLKLTLQNVIVVLSYAQGLRTVSDEFTQTLYAIHNGTNLSEDQQYSTAVYLNKLNLEPPCVASPNVHTQLIPCRFPEEYAYLHELSISPDPSGQFTSTALNPVHAQSMQTTPLSWRCNTTASSSSTQP